MNKKVKWGLIAFIACGLVVWGLFPITQIKFRIGSSRQSRKRR